MKRLTTDNPQNNTDAARNLFFIKDGEAWVRRGSPEPDYPDISLLSLMRRILATYGIHLEELDDQELSNELFDMLFYGPETTEGLIALLYSAGWAFAPKIFIRWIQYLKIVQIWKMLLLIVIHQI